MSLRDTFTKNHIEHFKNNKHLITSELLDALRSKGNEGKSIALEILDTEMNDEKYYLDSFGNKIAFDGNRTLKPKFVKMNLSEIHKEELTKCYNDIFYFIYNYVKTTTKSGVDFTEPRIYQKNLINLLCDDTKEDIISTLSRQAGKNFSVGVYVSHKVIFASNINIGIVANRGSQAREFLDRIKKIYMELPMWMKIGSVSWNKTYIEFDSGLRILTDVPNGNSFRGNIVHINIVDECLFSLILVKIRNKQTKEIIELQVGELYKLLNTNNSSGYISQNEYEVNTSSGWKNFDGINQTYRDDGITIKVNDKELMFTPEHRILVGKNKSGKIFRRVNKLKVNNKIQKRVITEIIYGEKELDFYDLINVEDTNHFYIEDGITSHNCAFISNNNWIEFSDSVFAAQTSLSWKKNILISTSNGQNHFYHIMQGAREGTNGYTPFEVPWQEIPRYDSKGNIKDPEDFKSEIVAKYGDVYFAQNYACDFIGSSYTLLSANTLQKIKHKKPLEKKDGMLNIYHEPIKGHQYVMSCDPSMGLSGGGDFFGVQILDITNLDMKQVASARLDIEYLKLPSYIHEWAQYYNNAYLIIENNLGSGQSIADMIVNNYEYENMHYDRSSENNKRKKYPGFRTTVKTRKQILDNFKLFAENGKLEINDEDTYKELFSFIYTKGKFQADDGCKDDMVMSLALCFAPFCNTKNFEDMREISKIIFGEAREEDTDVVSLLSFGFFDDGIDIKEDTSEWGSYDPYSNYESNF